MIERIEGPRLCRKVIGLMAVKAMVNGGNINPPCLEYDEPPCKLLPVGLGLNGLP